MKILVIIYELKMSSNSQGAIKRCVRITLVDNFLKSKNFASH